MICLIAAIIVFNVSINLAIEFIKQYIPYPKSKMKQTNTEHNDLKVLISYFSLFIGIGYFTKASEWRIYICLSEIFSIYNIVCSMSPPTQTSKIKQNRNTEHNDLNVLISYFSLIFGRPFLQRCQNGEII